METNDLSFEQEIDSIFQRIGNNNLLNFLIMEITDKAKDEEMDIQLGFSFLELRSATSRIEEALKHFGVECEAEIAQLRELTEKLNKRYDNR